MQNDYYYPQQYPVNNAPVDNIPPADNPNKKLIMLLIGLATLAIIAAIIVGTILIIKNINGSNGGATGEVDPNYITIEFDGAKFKVTDTYGDVIRQIAKQHKIYDWGGLMDHTYTEVTDIENYLSQYIKSDPEDYEGNIKNTVLKKSDSDLPDLFISVDRTIYGLDEMATKIDDADLSITIYPFLGNSVELKIDGHDISTKKTTSAEFEEMFKEAKEYVSDATGSEGYKGYSFTYKKRNFQAAFNATDGTLETLSIKTHIGM